MKPRISLWSVAPGAPSHYVYWNVEATGLYVAGCCVTGHDLSVCVDGKTATIDARLDWVELGQVAA